RHVMFFATREIVKSKGKLLLTNNAQIGVHDNAARATEIALNGHAAFGFASADNLDHARQLHEPVHDRVWVLGTGEDVNVLNSLFTSSQTAAQLQPLDFRTVA